MQGFFLAFALWLQAGEHFSPLKAGLTAVAFSGGVGRGADRILNGRTKPARPVAGHPTGNGPSAVRMDSESPGAGRRTTARSENSAIGDGQWPAAFAGTRPIDGGRRPQIASLPRREVTTAS
jgi:hypothetical protein